MKRKYILTFLLILSTLILVNCKPPRIPLGENDQFVKIDYNGFSRSFLLHTPAKHSEHPSLPLLIVLHGGGGTARDMLKLTNRRFNYIADREGAWIVYPQGIKKHWNDQRKDPLSYTHRKKIDDVGFIEEIIERMKQRYNIDSAKVFVTGISNGGFMSFRLAMELPDKIKAIAPVTASIPLDGVAAMKSGSSL